MKYIKTVQNNSNSSSHIDVLKEELEEMCKINIKPLSQNSSWAGRRFKTPKYKKYEVDVLLLLPPNIKIPPGKLKMAFVVGYSNKLSDADNFLKNFLDILQKKYGFNDNLVYRIEITKEIVKKGEEFVEFNITEYLN
jgi:Holliday junction resolvase RusA-like endonuclease